MSHHNSIIISFLPAFSPLPWFTRAPLFLIGAACILPLGSRAAQGLDPWLLASVISGTEPWLSFADLWPPNIQPSQRHPTYLSPVHGGHPCTTFIPTTLPLSSTELQNALTMPFSLLRKTSDARYPPSEREGNFKSPRFIPLRSFVCESLLFFNRHLPLSLKHCTTLLIPEDTINRMHTPFVDLNVYCFPHHSQYPCERGRLCHSHRRHVCSREMLDIPYMD